MTKSIFAFGAVVALVVGVPTVTLVHSVVVGVSAKLSPPPKYKLMQDLDGQLYAVDHDLTLEDCNNYLLTVSQWTHGHSAYTCSAQQGPAA